MIERLNELDSGPQCVPQTEIPRVGQGHIWNEPSRKASGRKLTLSATNLGDDATITIDEFTNSDGATLVAFGQRIDGQNRFSISAYGAPSSPAGLRELASELCMLAEHLDGNRTTVVEMIVDDTNMPLPKKKHLSKAHREAIKRGLAKRKKSINLKRK